MLTWPIVWIGVFSLAANALVLVVPLYLLQIYDRVLSSRSFETLVYLSIIAGAAIVAYGLLEAARTMMAQRAGARFEAQHGATVYRALLDGDSRGAGDVQALRDLAQLRAFIASRAAIALFDLPFVPLFTALVFLVHPVLGWLTVIGALVVVAIAIANQFVTQKAERSASEAAIGAAAMADAQRRAGEEIRAMAMQEHGLNDWGAMEARAVNDQDRVGQLNALFFGLSRTVRLCLQLSILGLGAYFVLTEGLSAGIIFAASLVSARALAPVDQVIGSWRAIAQARLAWRRIGGFLGQQPDAANKATRLPEAQGRVAVDRLVWMPRPGERPVLKGVSFALEAGECVAVIGPSGAGKTTLARILSGALAPTSGSVRLDGIALQHWHADDRGRATGYLAQDLNLLPASVARNIARLAPEPDDNAVVAAALFTGVHDFIGTLPQGYATPVGHGGLPLSGGQRQRIGLARAFYGGPKFVVLDEPNSHLDEAGSVALDKALERAKAAGITVFVVTQRHGVLARADRIMVLQGGAIDLFGPRLEVLRALKDRATANARPAQQDKVAPIGAYRATLKNAPGGPDA